MSLSKDFRLLQDLDYYRLRGLLKLDLMHFCIMIWLQAYRGLETKDGGLKEYDPIGS